MATKLYIATYLETRGRRKRWRFRRRCPQWWRSKHKTKVSSKQAQPARFL